MRNGMHVAHAGARERGSGVKRSELHVVPRFNVLAVGVNRFKVVKDELDRFYGERIRTLRRHEVCVGFHGMGERVHAGRARDMRRQAYGEFWVENGVPRNESQVVDGVFMMRRAVGDHRRDGGFGTRSGGGRHGEHRRYALEHLQRAAHLGNALTGLDNARAGGLGAVHRGAAAKGDDALTLVFHIELSCVLDVFN